MVVSLYQIQYLEGIFLQQILNNYENIAHFLDT